MIEVSDTWTAGAARRHLRSVRVLVWAGLLTASALVLAFMPLLGVLGFEFAFVMALLGSLAAGDLGAAFVRRVRAVSRSPLARAAEPGRLVAVITGRALLVNLALLVPPLVVISLNALRVRNCDWLFGIETYVMMTGLSVVLSTGLGVAAGLIAGERRILSNALPYLIVATAIVVAVIRFYAAPPVFAYSMFAGYFPGNLYDENIALGAPFYWSRLFQLAAVGALLGLCALLVDVPTLRLRLKGRRPERLRIRPAALTLGAGALATVLWWASGHVGYSIDADDIKAQLGGRYETENFVIYYPPGGDIERDIELIAEDHEFRYAQAVRTLGVEVPHRIVSFYFPDADEKFRLMGARNVYMAKPWREEIYVHHQGFPHHVLRHEIAHVVAGVFGDPLFHVSARRVLGLPVFFNVGMIEGIAVAADWPDHFTRELTPHQSVKAMDELGFTPPLDRVFSTRFLEFSSARSYTVAGSFTRYLLDTYGADRLRAAYRSGGDFAAAYGKSLGDLQAEWQQMIDAVELPERTAAVVEERFRRPGIFHRPCPHAVAKQRLRAGELAADGRLEQAIRVIRGLCADVPGEPSYRLELAGLYQRAGQDAEAVPILQTLAEDQALTSSLRAQAMLQLAGIAARQGTWDRVDALLEQAASLPLEEDLARNVAVQRFAVAHPGPAGAPLRGYFWGSDPRTGWDPVLAVGRAAQVVAAEPELALGHYLVGRMLRGRGDEQATVRSLDTAVRLGLADPLVEREAARLLAEAAYMARDWAALERAAAILGRADQPRVVQLYGADWLERMYWKQHGRLPPAVD